MIFLNIQLSNRELELFVKWFALNKLSLNVKKNNFIVFCNKNISCDINVFLNGDTIPYFNEISPGLNVTPVSN